MSTIQANAILDASGGNTTTINGVTPNTDSVRGRNLLINGAMQVWQRGTSFTGFNTLAYHTDRFQSYNSSNASGESTISKSTDAPDGFGNSYKLEVTTADSSLHVNAEYGLYHYFEGQDLQGLKKGTSDAKSLTASFWVKSSVTGTFIVELMDNDNSNRHINKSYTINAANTWEYKTITFEGDTVGTLDNDNNNSFHINWWLGGGTGFTGGTLQTSWGTLNQANRAAGQTNVHATVGNTWQITGVQLEVGSVATEFDHRSFAEELALCQRYYQKNISTSSETSMSFCRGQAFSASSAYVYFEHPVEMRTKPTMSNSIASIGNFGALAANGGGCGISGLTYVSAWSSKWTSTLSLTVASGTLSTGQATEIDAGGNSNAFLAFDAEL
jgi:hypothetical protein